jgi:hypothetical protein
VVCVVMASPPSQRITENIEPRDHIKRGAAIEAAVAKVGGCVGWWLGGMRCVCACACVCVRVRVYSRVCPQEDFFVVSHTVPVQACVCVSV